MISRVELAADEPRGGFQGVVSIAAAEREEGEATTTTTMDLLASIGQKMCSQLHAMLGAAELLGESVLDAEQRECVSLMRRNGANLLSLVNDILAVASPVPDPGTSAGSQTDVSENNKSSSASAGGPATAVARPLDILLAEDHADYRYVVQGYLRRTPHRLTMTEDGFAAVEAFKKRSFDVVLMDMHMPVMDGLDATRAMRAHERESGRQPTAILALTAHRLPLDRERTRQAGCDAHLCKPIAKSALLAALTEHARPLPHAAPPPEDDILAGVDPDLADLVPGYIQNRLRDLTVCRDHLQQGRFAELRVIAHGMAGSGGAYGFDEITRIGRALQAAAVRRDAADCEVLLDELDSYVRRVDAACKR